jgi:hypothetical protein
MRAISLAPALKLMAVQLRELGTIVRTHYEECVQRGNNVVRTVKSHGVKNS